jgi:Mn2+/Fe2+ NRAMP family transporter
MLKRWRIRILLFLAVLGPGFITANIDNDSGGILTYSNAGAQFGYTLLWTMIPITVALLVVQEMCARMGAVTGKGLSDLIREEFGLRMTFILMLLLVIVNFGNVMTEFVGIAGSMQLFHISKYISVPASALLIWLLVVKGDYKGVEKVFLAASVFYIAYIVTGVLYLQSSIVEKGVTAKSYPASRLDVVIGSFFTNIVAWFIVVACAATLFAHGMGAIKEAADAAEAMKPLAGRYAFLLFAVGLFNASLFAASILPLSTAYTVCEGLGLQSGLDGGFKDAPVFYWLYTLLVAGGAIAVLFVPNTRLISMVILSQVLNGVLLPLVIVFMLLLINRKDLMGEHVNSRWFNAVAWLTAAVVIVLSLFMMFTGGAS